MYASRFAQLCEKHLYASLFIIFCKFYLFWRMCELWNLHCVYVCSCAGQKANCASTWWSVCVQCSSKIRFLLSFSFFWCVFFFRQLPQTILFFLFTRSLICICWRWNITKSLVCKVRHWCGVCNLAYERTSAREPQLANAIACDRATVKIFLCKNEQMNNMDHVHITLQYWQMSTMRCSFLYFYFSALQQRRQQQQHQW